MSPTVFVNRPVLAMVISILIVVVGLLALRTLAVDQYPQITPPAVEVRASYPGADAVTVAEAVAQPLEQELNGTPNMLYMESSCSSSGRYSVRITFEIGTDPNIAAMEVQNRVKLAESQMPAEVIQNGIEVDKLAPITLMTVALVSTEARFDEIYLSNYMMINVRDALRRIPGVGRISNMGGRAYAMRVWLQPDRLASFGLTPADVQAAIRDQNRSSAAGEIGAPPSDGAVITLPVIARGRLTEVRDFEQIVVKAGTDGSLIRLHDVARVELGTSNYKTIGRLDGGKAALIRIMMLPGANALQVARDVRAALEVLSREFPQGVEYRIPVDITEYIDESVSEVYTTLFQALAIVVAVVFLSLQGFRAALVPAIAIPVSLIGTFGFMKIAGFSVNSLTLLGLILAIGIVVDDAIVVVESVQHGMAEERLDARTAALKTMQKLAGALIATSLVLVAVFVPVSFLGGLSGELYRQFAATIAVSVVLSTVVALTLSPALCALLLTRGGGLWSRVFRPIDWSLDRSRALFTALVRRSIVAWPLAMLVYGGVLVAAVTLFRWLPTGFIPQEDQGYFTVEIVLPDGATLDRTDEVCRRAEEIILRHPTVDNVQSYVGAGLAGLTSSRGQLTVTLTPWSQRTRPGTHVDAVADAILDELRFPEAIVNVRKPPVIPGLGHGGGFELQLQQRSTGEWREMVDTVEDFLAAANESSVLDSVSSGLQGEIPHLRFDLDRERAQMFGVPLAEVFGSLKSNLGSTYVNDFNKFGRVYRVYLQADAPFRSMVDDLQQLFLRNDRGEMLPASALGSTSIVSAPGVIRRFNMYPSALITGSAADGRSSGEAMEELEALAARTLPDGFGFEWSGVSLQERAAGAQLGPILLLSVGFVFLVLAALYESWLVPIAVMLTVPVAALGALAAAWFAGLDNDIYFQIGLITLIGLAAKNAILVVEYAKARVDDGAPVHEAAIEAARSRFRPVLMTSLSFILGVLPLVLASGAGAMSRRAVGTGVFGGMIAATTAGLVFAPVFFVLVMWTRSGVRRLVSRRTPREAAS